MKKLAIGLVLCLGLSAFSFSGPLGPNEAYIIRNEAALWQEQSGGVLKWAENLTIGDQVTLLNRTAKFKLEGAEREFIKVKALDGMEGWVRTLYVAPKASLGVIKADGAIVYSEPRDVKITSKSISSMTIVAMLQEGSTSSFAKVMCYDATQKNPSFVDSTFIALEDVSTSEADVNAVILYTVAAAAKNPDVKKNLLKKISSKYSDSPFLPKIQAALSGVPAASKPTTPSSGRYAVNDDNVNVRAVPDEKDGQVVGHLDRDAQVDVLEVTTDTYKVGNMTAAWYRIKDPAGWVFGGFLDRAQ